MACPRTDPCPGVGLAARSLRRGNELRARTDALGDAGSARSLSVFEKLQGHLDGDLAPCPHEPQCAISNIGIEYALGDRAKPRFWLLQPPQKAEISVENRAFCAGARGTWEARCWRL